MQDDIFASDLGLELLMNPKKKSSDAMSVISSASARSYQHSGSGGRHSRSESETSSVRSVQVPTQFVDVKAYGGKQHFSDEQQYDEYENDADDDDEEGDLEGGDYEVEEDDYSAGGDEARSTTSSRHRYSPPPIVRREQPRHVMSEDEILTAKREYLYQFDRLEKKGMKLPRKFTLASSLEDMKMEYDRLRRDREIDNSVQFQRKTMITVVSGIELLNTWFNTPAKLDGWSDSINDSIEQYDDIFEELHDKYKGKAKMAPEIKLLLMVGASGLMYHMSNNLAKQFTAPPQAQMGGGGGYGRSNPMMSGIGSMLSSMLGGGGGGAGGLAGMFSSMMGGGNQGGMNMNDFPSTPPPVPPGMAQQMNTTMRGPSNVEDILRDIDNDRIEVMSTLTGSELTDFADDASINNLLMNKRGKRGKKTLEI